MKKNLINWVYSKKSICILMLLTAFIQFGITQTNGNVVYLENLAGQHICYIQGVDALTGKMYKSSLYEQGLLTIGEKVKLNELIGNNSSVYKLVLPTLD